MLLFKKGSVNMPEPKSNEGVGDFGEEQGTITGLNCKKTHRYNTPPCFETKGQKSHFLPQITKKQGIINYIYNYTK